MFLSFVMKFLYSYRAPCLDIAFSPFNDNVIASCSEDATAKVLWKSLYYVIFFISRKHKHYYLFNNCPNSPAIRFGWFPKGVCLERWMNQLLNCVDTKKESVITVLKKCRYQCNKLFDLKFTKLTLKTSNFIL